ncbi:undecaprenyldiphospho-muramoylpentapeptide beta-N-acetylglucosaminyltransferase [Betaproteobacteria bacterium]|nr:undecaprenyldiphospho-muramoylpentapeptide beta-N-acetylglucosaminyltransferase [Betaproteobacteria bacterium]
MVRSEKTKVLVCAGGTGGHIFPGLAIAEKLLDQKIKILWMGTKRGLEKQALHKKSINLFFSEFKGVRGLGLWRLMSFPFRLLVEAFNAFMFLQKQSPSYVICCGGYLTVPFGLAAKILSIPFCVVEQNAVMGTANRVLQPFAKTIFLNFNATTYSSNRAIPVGNPLRKEFEDLVTSPPSFTRKGEQLNILVLGGSLGALFLNKRLPECFSLLQDENKKFFSIVHQTGNDNQNEVIKSYRRLKVTAVVKPFFERIVEQYQWADLVISRSGAGIISELTAVGVASVLVPLPNAIDDHQERNARILENLSAAKIIKQNASFQAELISFLCAINREKLIDMAHKAKELARFNSAKVISDEVIKALNAK